MAEDGLPLFDYRPTPPKATEQDRQIERVSSRIRSAICEFAKAHVGRQFHADELRAFVEEKCGKTAPGSADRILRALKQGAVIAYRVVDRSKSLYEIEGA